MRGDALRHVLGCLVLMCMFSRPGAAQTAPPGPPEANPGRPTVSTPATLTPVGYLQFETGFLAARHSPEFSSRYSLNETIKVSVARRLELLTSTEPAVRYSAGGTTANGVAEVFLGAQGVIAAGEGGKPTVAVSYFHRAYSGGVPEPDFGSPSNSFLLLASADVKGFHYDANAIFNELNEEAVRRGQFGQSLTISHRVAPKLTLSGEIWHFTQPFLQSHAVGSLWALSYAARKNVVFDGGFNRGFTSTSTRWDVFVGFTYLLPHRLW